MKGVSMIRATNGAHAYCIADGAERGCSFERHASVFGPSNAEVRNEAQRHVQRTGHSVLVDVVDRTDYAPEPARETAKAGESA